MSPKGKSWSPSRIDIKSLPLCHIIGRGVKRWKNVPGLILCEESIVSPGIGDTGRNIAEKRTHWLGLDFVRRDEEHLTKKISHLIAGRRGVYQKTQGGDSAKGSKKIRTGRRRGYRGDKLEWPFTSRAQL